MVDSSLVRGSQGSAFILVVEIHTRFMKKKKKEKWWDNKNTRTKMQGKKKKKLEEKSKRERKKKKEIVKGRKWKTSRNEEKKNKEAKKKKIERKRERNKYLKWKDLGRKMGRKIGRKMNEKQTTTTTTMMFGLQCVCYVMQHVWRLFTGTVTAPLQTIHLLIENNKQNASFWIILYTLLLNSSYQCLYIF